MITDAARTSADTREDEGTDGTRTAEERARRLGAPAPDEVGTSMLGARMLAAAKTAAALHAQSLPDEAVGATGTER